MTTLVRRFENAEFADTLIANIEPDIALPDSVLGAYRLRGSLEFSKKNRSSGAWLSLISADTGSDVSYGPNYAQSAVGGKTLGVYGQPLPSGSLSFAVVNYAGIINAVGSMQTLIGAASVGTNFYGIRRSNTSLNVALTVNGIDAVSGTPAPETNRYDMMFGVVDATALTAMLYYPRTGSMYTGTITAPVPPGSAARVLGSTVHSAAVRNAWAAVFGAALTTAEMDAIYASARASMIVTGIEI